MKHFLLTLLCVTGITVYVTAQSNEITQRYISIETELSEFFKDHESLNSVVYCNFELINIYENESSKPAFVNVNDISGVVKFSIKSKSEKYENRRACFLQLSNSSYLYTFMLVLEKMEVKYILFKGDFIKIDDFFKNIL
jgi:hypothetical protein